MKSIMLSPHPRNEPIEFRYAKVTTASTETESPYTSAASIYKGMWLDSETDRTAELTGAVLWTRTAVAEGDWVICIRTPFGRWDGLTMQAIRPPDPVNPVYIADADPEGTPGEGPLASCSADTFQEDDVYDPTDEEVENDGVTVWMITRIAILTGELGEKFFVPFYRKLTWPKSIAPKVSNEFWDPCQISYPPA